MIWKCRDKKIEYGKKTVIMGILNVTPDSFSDGGDHLDPNNAISFAKKLEEDGADIIDIGAQSTRPGHTPVSPEEEWKRLEPILRKIRENTKLPVSVDTYYPQVAEKAVKTGADIINDVSGIFSRETAKIVKSEECGWILMHNGGGTPRDVRNFFENMIKECENFGISKNQICLDMGIGFGKSYEENIELLARVREYKIHGCPLLLGTSRKRVIAEGSRQDDPKKRVYGNIAADAAAIFGGADIVRIHDVENEKQGIFMADALKDAFNKNF